MIRLEPHSPGAVFLQLVSQIEARLRKAKRARSFRDPEIANGLRGDLFKLEGWAKLHRSWPVKSERKIFETLRDQTKELEDLFGAIDAAKEISADLVKRGERKLSLMFDDQAEALHHKLKKILKSKKWFVAKGKISRTERIRAKLVKIKWPSMTVQSDYLLQSLFQELSSFSARYREDLKPKLLRDVYDRDILENDLHKLRRELRWFSMYFQTADGLIGLAPAPSRLTKSKQTLVRDYRKNPFAVLPSKTYAKAFIDPVAFYELTRLIEILGYAKDRAEKYFRLRDALIAQGCTQDDAIARAEGLYGDVPHTTPRDAHLILSEFEKMKPHVLLAESLFE